MPIGDLMRVLICDDDAVLRRVVGGVARSAGHEIVAECDNATDAIELTERLAPDAIVLDLALAVGTGREVLDSLRGTELRTRVLVFSAFAADRGALLDGGASAVVDKPDFEGLEQVLAAWAAQPSETGGERRRDRTQRRMPESTARSPGGLEPDGDFYAALGAVEAGDALLVLWIETHGLLVSRNGPHVAVDWLMELARLARDTIRAQDRMACFDGRHLHVLLVGGRAIGAQRVGERLKSAWELVSSEPIGWSFAVHDEDISIEQLLHWASPAPV